MTQDLNRLAKRHHFEIQGTESDGIAVVTQCGARRDTAGIPFQFTDLPEGSADDVYMSHVWALDEKIKQAAWGADVPDISVIDPTAERAGQNFVERVRSSDPFNLLDQFLYAYKGPLGKPAMSGRSRFRRV